MTEGSSADALAITLGVEEEFFLIDPDTRDLLADPDRSIFEYCEKNRGPHQLPGGRPGGRCAALGCEAELGHALEVIRNGAGADRQIDHFRLRRLEGDSEREALRAVVGWPRKAGREAGPGPPDPFELNLQLRP